MTIYEYEERYVKRQNIKGAKSILTLIVVALGVIVAACLTLVSLRFWELNLYAGIAATVVCLVIFILCFILPVVRIRKLDAFQVAVTHRTARAAQKHNRELRSFIAQKMIDVVDNVEAVGWYDEEAVGQLAIALAAKNDAKLKDVLTGLYAGSVKDTAKSMIFKSAVKSATYSALSQSNKADAALVAVVNLQMIKDVVFLYGFRPSEARLLKIFAHVLQNSLIAYGLGGMRIGNGVARTVGDMTKGIPLLGSAISVLVDSSVQGLTNATLTAIIGYQTIKYLNEEYRLQDILDGVEVTETEEELKETCADIEKQLRSKKVSA